MYIYIYIRTGVVSHVLTGGRHIAVCGLHCFQLLSSLLFLQANKPLVERKRRGRINKSIDELKEIVLQALNKDVSHLNILPLPNLQIHPEQGSVAQMSANIC